MTLPDRLKTDITEALKAGRSLEVEVLRMLRSSIHNKEIEKGSTGASFTDVEAMAVFLSEAKKRKEAIAIFEKGGRKDLAEKEQKELAIIAKYLPEEMSPAAVKEAVQRIISESGASDFGGAMKAVMKELRGKADANLVTEQVKRELGAS